MLLQAWVKHSTTNNRTWSRKRRLNWFDYIQRRDPQSYVKTTYKEEFPGKRKKRKIQEMLVRSAKVPNSTPHPWKKGKGPYQVEGTCAKGMCEDLNTGYAHKSSKFSYVHYTFQIINHTTYRARFRPLMEHQRTDHNLQPRTGRDKRFDGCQQEHQRLFRSVLWKHCK